MTNSVKLVSAPIRAVYRVGKYFGGGASTFYEPPPWSTSFNSRWDDPRITSPTRSIPKEECFRVIYFASECEGAHVEVFQRHIANPQAMAKIFGGIVPTNPYQQGGNLSYGEITRRHIGSVTLDSGLRFADIVDLSTRTFLYHTEPTIPPLVEKLQLGFLTDSAVTGNTQEHRNLTKEIALCIMPPYIRARG